MNGIHLHTRPGAHSPVRPTHATLICCALLAVHLGAALCRAADPPLIALDGGPAEAACSVLADERLADPLGSIADEFRRRTGAPITLALRPADEVNRLAKKPKIGDDLVLSMPVDAAGSTAVSALAGARKVAWKHPSGEPVWGDRETAMREVYRVLRQGGAAVIGGRYRHMPEGRRVSSDVLRASAANTGIPAIRVYDDMGQWVEILKGVKDRDGFD